MTSTYPGLLADSCAAENEDGRKARRDRNRDAVVDALLELYGEGHLDPSSDEIATRAGLSPRSLFRYFDDIDDLCQSAINRQHERLRHLFDISVDVHAPTDRRIEALVAQRSDLYDAIGGVGRAARLRSPFQPLIAAELALARTHLRNQIKRVMKNELTAMTAHQATAALAAADVLCSFESYQLMRFDQSLSRPKVNAVLTDALSRLFSPDRTAPRTGEP